MASVVDTREWMAVGKKTGDIVPGETSGRLRVAFVVGGLFTEASGVQRIVCDLTNELRRQGALPTIYTAQCDGQPLATHMLAQPSDCIAAPGWRMGRLAWSPGLKRVLHTAVPKIDVVHNHNLWMLPNHYASTAAHRWKKPVVFTAMGFLEPWALARSRWKKRLVGWWFQDRDLRQAACIHVNSVQEIKSVREYGLRNPVAVIPNGVHLETFSNLSGADLFRARHPQLADKKICLFLSRLHEKKGLRHLVEAWARLAKDYAGWHLAIAGPDDGFETETRRMIEGLGIEGVASLVGPQFGPQKLQALAAADAFVLPSFSEGFAMAILEAMAASLPVLLTPGCNFPEVVRAGAGIEVQPTVGDTERGLRELLSASEAERAAMGRAGRELVAAKYTWKRVASDMLALYRWLAAGEPQPVFVCKS